MSGCGRRGFGAGTPHGVTTACHGPAWPFSTRVLLVMSLVSPYQASTARPRAQSRLPLLLATHRLRAHVFRVQGLGQLSTTEAQGPAGTPLLSLRFPGCRQPVQDRQQQKLGQSGENPGDTWGDSGHIGADRPRSQDMANKSPTDKAKIRSYPFHAIPGKLSGVPPAGRTRGVWW